MNVDLGEIAYVPTTGVRRVHETPLVAATNISLEGYGCLVETPAAFPIEIVRWPAQGWRPVDANSATRAASPKASSSLPGGARRCTRATMRSETAICSGGATGRKRPPLTALARRAHGR